MEATMSPRDVMKLAFQFKEHAEIPFLFNCSEDQAAGLTAYYGGEDWKKIPRNYVCRITGVDNFLSLAGYQEIAPDRYRDRIGCVWEFGSTHHLVEPPLKEPSLNGFRLPDIDEYFTRYVRPLWERKPFPGDGSFRVVGHSFGLFERAWSLRGFEQFLMDLIDNPRFCEELLEMIAEWTLRSIDNLLSAPVDAIRLTDDYADQQGMIFGLERFRRFFKPHWKRIFSRIRKAGVYSVLHVCGCAAPAAPDLIECGLDCLESLQPEAMDIYKLKKEYGGDLRLWGGLGAQSVLPFGSSDEVRREVKRLKEEMGRGGGYILAGAKGIREEVPLDNVIAYLEEAPVPVVR
jgi:uroporphyrinogen decarboxylase